MDARLHCILCRIFKDRLRFSLSGLYFYIYEPSIDIIEESYDIYNSSYEIAYGENNMTDEELSMFLIENDIWNPLEDREIEEHKKQLDSLRVEAYENCFKPKDLRNIKSKINRVSGDISSLLTKKHSMDHLSCSGIAEQSRFNWIISKTSFHSSGKKINWRNNRLSSFISTYREKSIEHKDLRAIARSDPWRTVWSLSKKTGDLFGVPCYSLSKDRLSLCSYSGMYDSVYESTDCPTEKVICDDDCLDGWFIKQKEKYEASKKEKESESLVKNQKIANSKEIFLMAKNDEEAKNIFNLNSMHGKSIINQRQQVIQEKGKVSDLDFNDVRTELQMQQNQMFISKMRGK